MVRILWTGAAPWCNSGYAKPLRNLIPLLHKAGHRSAIATYSGLQHATLDVRINDVPVRLYPPFKAAYFNDCIDLHAADWQADVVISLQDVWLLDEWANRDFRWLPWVPIDCSRITEPVAKALQNCQIPLSMSKHGQTLLQEAGWPQAHYVPMGVDTSLYKPGSLIEARARAGLPATGYLVGMIAANSSFPSRKSFPEVLLAWQRYLDKGGSGTLYIHALLQAKYHERRGLFLPTLLDSLNLRWATLDDPDGIEGASVLFPSQYKMWTSAYSDADLVNLYNSFDVLLNPSQSEGFGIPILEAQACGIPVVTLNTTAMPEITFAGLCLDPLQPTWELQGGWRGLAGVDDLLEALVWADDLRTLSPASQQYRDRARSQSIPFDWQALVDSVWLPLLDEAVS